ncbi:MAG: penicillin-binding protein 2 [Bacteroidales bacterium]|nr:penicillin-binding protein 2 [Candidatus Cacconaster merdequi]
MLVILTVAAFLIMAVRLFFVQIVDKQYRITAENNALKYETTYPARGRILDRNGVIIVGNNTSYDIMVTPADVKEFDTLELCRIFNLDTSFVKGKFREYKLYRTRIGFQTLTFKKQISNAQYNEFVEKSFMFPGFTGVPRTLRTYPLNVGGNLLGYISEVDADYLKAHPEYKSGDYAGKTGMEAAYEEILRGEKGYSIYLRDSRNRIMAPYQNGEYDKGAIPGTDVVTTIDSDLQAFGESLMRNKVGSLVAIEPSTGEILTMVSSPGINVSQLSEINKYYKDIVSDPYKPMFNRAVMSPQPPGSVFKLVNGLIGLQEGVLTPYTMHPCHSGYTVGNLRVGCHSHQSPINMYQSIMMSCNAYYCYVFRDIIDNKKYGSVTEAFTKWKEYTESFGFGRKLSSDFPSEQAGTMPTVERYDRLHGKGRWKSLSIISLSIGQGEIGCTPLHLANFAATLANRGYYYIPHIQKDTPAAPLDSSYRKRNYTMVDTSYFHEVVKGMYLAINGEGGATASIARIPGIEACGKTGTAQNPHGDDHSVFICFAPMDNPKIAVAAYIENGGFGATWAAPIASLLVEKYLCGEISQERKYLEERVLSGNLMDKVKVRRKR